MKRLLVRALSHFGKNVAILLAVLIAGFLGAAIGIWASVVWGFALVTAAALIIRRRTPTNDSDTDPIQ